LVGAQDIHISLVIPAFNEAVYLPRLLDTVDAARAAQRASRSIAGPLAWRAPTR
jgi:hypothetical protein